jgi:serine/threonine protein kinase
MSLASGVRLGVYEIVALVGSGGMGEVYRARDPRLGRDVAIKVLPSAFAADEERLRRFEQEARAAAALNHPNILAVHDIGEHDGAPYIVSELLEGETLRDRLRRSREGSTASASSDQGPLPVRKAIEYAVGIAHGLAAAHDKGIVHRDLKPENVFIVSDGRVKILDFGLAKLTEREPALSGVTAIPTTPPDTLPGVVLGTIGYMSPEQVRGLAADHRSDIFSFGTILYELLSGQRAFRGETSADTMTAILKDDPPDLPTAERKLPPALARIVDRCLEKTPAARFQSAEDLAFALDALSTQSGATESMIGSVATPRAREKQAWALVAALSVALVAALAWAAVAQFWRAPIEQRALRFIVPPPDGWSLPVVVRQTTNQVSGRSPVAVSPDGRRIAFIARNAEKDALWIRSLDTLISRMLPGTEGVSAPFWSPDSRFIGFFADDKLKKIDISGGPPIPVCDSAGGTAGAWSSDGVIVFAQTTPSGPGSSTASVLQRVPTAGGVPTQATTLQPGDSNHTRPVFLPDGRHFVYSVTSARSMPIYLASLDSATRTKLIDVD